jgi:PAS domain S-box-containing protein
VQALRRQAEDSIRDHADSLPEVREPTSPEEVQRLIHELRVHQIELEMQNTELRRSQGELEASRSRYFDLYDLAPVGYFTLSEKGLIQEANLKAAELVGIPRSALVGQPLSGFIHSGDKDIYYLHRDKLIKTGAPQVFELRMVSQDNAGFLAHLEAAVKDADGVPAIRMVVSDITARKRSEELLRQSNAMLSLFMKHSPIYAFIKEATPTESRVLMASENFLEMTGIPGSEMVGKTMAELFPAEFAAKITDDDRAVVSGGNVFKHDEDLNGRHYTTIKFPIFHEDKILLAGYTIDITDRKRAETLLRESEQDLREKNAELRRFSYAVSHDLKSPLITIETFLNYLEQDIGRKDAEQIDKDMAYIRHAAGKMGTLLDELLGLSRIGRLVSAAVTSPLQSIVQDALNIVAGQIARQGVKVEVSAEPVDVFGDRSRLVEVFQNLVDNAVKFMGDQPAPKIEIGVTAEGDESVFFVRDNGIGFDPQQQHRLFALFEKLDPETKGSGLGLALVKRIVENHGGRIYADSEGPGRGSTFCFTLATKPND